MQPVGINPLKTPNSDAICRLYKRATSATEMTPVIYNGLSDKTPVEWTFLKNYEVFSLSPDGSFPMVKVSRSKAVRLSDREVLMVGGGRCYRVSLSNHYTPTP
jgi:hypothetical protein